MLFSTEGHVCERIRSSNEFLTSGDEVCLVNEVSPELWTSALVIWIVNFTGASRLTRDTLSAMQMRKLLFPLSVCLFSFVKSLFFLHSHPLCCVLSAYPSPWSEERWRTVFFCLSGFFLFRTLWLSYQHPSVLFCRICTSPDTFHSPFCCWQQSHHCSVGVFVWSNPPQNKNPANFETTLRTGMGVETVVNQTEKGRITFFSPFFLQQKSIITQTTWSSKHPVWTE